jgi:hypothetical protein
MTAVLEESNIDSIHCLCSICIFEGWDGGGNSILSWRHLGWIRLAPYVMQFFSEENRFCKGGFALFTLISLSETSHNMSS